MRSHIPADASGGEVSDRSFMPLLAFWKSNPEEINKASIEQIVAMAGDGNLRDNSLCSDELRKYLTEADSPKLTDYIDRCLDPGFPKSGFVFQDLVNELGRRLDYKVLNGRYQGTTNEIGYDGIWTSPEGHTVIAEVKTTDAYRIPLDTIAGYRQRLLIADKIKQPSSILILVGRQDTGELEAQIRGSRHAWDVRLISAEALIKLVSLKENSDDPETGSKIRNLLTPMEFTRLDALVDVMFTTATDVEAVISGLPEDKMQPDTVAAPKDTFVAPSGWEFTDFAVLDKKRSIIIEAMDQKIGAKLIKKSRALFWDASHEARVACSISKRYPKSYLYWYAYHPEWNSFLQEGQQSYFVLGCMDLEFAFAIPLKVIAAILAELNTTTTSKKTYWHVHIVEVNDGGFAIPLHGGKQLELDQFKVALKP
jgi:hypothetical protein